MEEMYDLLVENTEELGNLNSPLANKIHQQLEGAFHQELRRELETYHDTVQTAQEELRENDDRVKARGIDDAVDAIESKLDLAAGQINVSRKVIKAGADQYKAAEYLENAYEAIVEAIDQITKLTEFINQNCTDTTISDDALINQLDRSSVSLKSVYTELS